jgi:hypothetical protein
MGRPVYQLHAVGEYRYFEGAGTIVSREVYTSRERAEAAIEEFERRCCGSPVKKGSMSDLTPKGLVVVVKELELIE